MRHLALSVTLPLALLLAACGNSSPPPESPADDAAAAPAGSAVAPAGQAGSAAAPAAQAGAPAGGGQVVDKVEITPAVRAAVDAADRSEADRALDAGRKPAELLSFLGIAPGMKVAELGAGGGYTAELLARVVGPSGAVYGQNNKFIIERFAEKPWTERLKKPLLKNVVRVDREFDDPLPPEAQNLDAVLMVLFYHDTFWMNVNRDAMNRAIHRALKPGGVYAIVDHSGRAGTGATEVKTIHRIEEKIVREEIERAGFRLAAEASFLKNPADTRDWNASPMAAADKRGSSDRFVLKFVKPAQP